MKSPAKKKIIFSSYDDTKNPYYGGGGAIAIREIATRCPEFDVTVITGNYPGAKNKTDHGVRYKRVGPSYLGPRVSQLLFHMILPFYVKRATFDLWIESFTPPVSTSFLQLYTKKPVIGLIHMLSAEDMIRKYKLPFQLIEHMGLKTYRHFIALTDVTQEKISRLNPEATISLIPNGVEINNANLKKSSPENYILYIGRIEINQKGLDLLLEAYASIQANTDAKLLIAGSGLLRDERILKDKIKQAGLQSKVKVLGRVAGHSKEQLLANASLIVVPSRLETFGIVVLEAMAFGKPVVTFDIKGLEWIPSECALKAQAFDVRDLGAKMYQILSSQELQKSMSLAINKVIGAYSWDNVAVQYRTAILEALGQ